MLIVCDGATVRLISQLRNGGLAHITALSEKDRKWTHASALHRNRDKLVAVSPQTADTKWRREYLNILSWFPGLFAWKCSLGWAFEMRVANDCYLKERSTAEQQYFAYLHSGKLYFVCIMC